MHLPTQLQRVRHSATVQGIRSSRSAAVDLSIRQ